MCNNCTASESEQLRHRFKNHLQVILGFARMGMNDEVIDYVRSVSGSVGGNATIAGDVSFWPCLISIVHELAEAGIDCTLQISNWAAVPSIGADCMAAVQNYIDGLLASESLPTQLTMEINGKLSQLEIWHRAVTSETPMESPSVERRFFSLV